MGHFVKRRSGNRLKYQVTECIKSINGIGVSKRNARKFNANQIHSFKQIKEVLSVSQNFVTWLQEQDINDLFQLKKAHYRNYLDHMRRKNLSNGYLINIETNLRLLNKGMLEISRKKRLSARQWVPKERIVEYSLREKPLNRSIAPTQIQEIYEKLSDNARTAMNLQLAFGLRLREVAKTTAAFIQEENGKLYWVASEDKKSANAAAGVTKGGRPRKIPCLRGYETIVEAILKGKDQADFLIPIKYNSIKSAYYRAGMTEGSHGLRHTYARQMLLIQFEELQIEFEDGRRMMTHIIENKSAGYRKDHLVKKDDKELYCAVNKAMDIIHGFLGHGSNRTDLARVYLSE